jgi:hypothetical protein
MLFLVKPQSEDLFVKISQCSALVLVQGCVLYARVCTCACVCVVHPLLLTPISRVSTRGSYTGRSNSGLSSVALYGRLPSMALSTYRPKIRIGVVISGGYVIYLGSNLDTKTYGLNLTNERIP